jgi:hypothetical protein
MIRFLHPCRPAKLHKKQILQLADGVTDQGSKHNATLRSRSSYKRRTGQKVEKGRWTAIEVHSHLGGSGHMWVHLAEDHVVDVGGFAIQLMGQGFAVTHPDNVRIALCRSTEFDTWTRWHIEALRHKHCSSRFCMFRR